jgi:hypothetical protein
MRWEKRSREEPLRSDREMRRVRRTAYKGD